MDILTTVGYVGFGLTVVGVLLQIHDKIPERYGRKLWYFLFNAKFAIDISTSRKYPEFKMNTFNLKLNIEKEFLKENKRIKHLIYGSNYIEILIAGRQAPYFIKFMPEMDPNDPEKRRVVSINLLGTIAFRYKEDLDNKKYLGDIEDLFRIIESTYQIHPTFENYNLISTNSKYDGTENKYEKIEEDNSIVDIGTNKLNIHSRSLHTLYEVYKKNISTI